MEDLRLLAWRPVPVGAEVLEAGWLVQDRFGLSCRDALIVAAARVIGCQHLLTEDLQHGAASSPTWRRRWNSPRRRP